MVDDPFHVDVSAKLRRIVGEPLKGTHTFEAEGDQAALQLWSDAIFAEYGSGLVSPGGVLMFAPVSRAAVYKRLEEGRLTAFMFYLKSGKAKRGSPYIYIPVVECRAWAEDLERRKRNPSETIEEWRARRREERGPLKPPKKRSSIFRRKRK